MHYFYIKNFFNGVFYCFNTRIAKFQNLAGIGAYNVIVLFKFMRFFKLCEVLTKLMFSNQIASQ